MKKISISMGTYNEEKNIIPICEAVINQFKEYLSEYDYEIIIIDNDSQDKTRDLIIKLCDSNKKIKAIFNSRNFGASNSGFHAMLQTTGDCCIGIPADFQTPVDLIPKFVKEWEKGYKLVLGIKTKSKENKVIRFIRDIYYNLLKRYSDIEQLKHLAGISLLDNSIIKTLGSFKDPLPFGRGMLAEIGLKSKRILIPYTQEKRRAGKSSYNFFKYYDFAMLSFTSYTKVGLRVAVFLGFFISFLSIFAAIFYFVLKLIYWDRFPAGNIPILLSVLILGGIQMFFIGLIGEYIITINTRLMNRPHVIEECRINFDDSSKEK